MIFHELQVGTLVFIYTVPELYILFERNKSVSFFFLDATLEQKSDKLIKIYGV